MVQEKGIEGEEETEIANDINTGTDAEVMRMKERDDEGDIDRKADAMVRQDVSPVRGRVVGEGSGREKSWIL